MTLKKTFKMVLRWEQGNVFEAEKHRLLCWAIEMMRKRLMTGVGRGEKGQRVEGSKVL